jgi:hypothetical protein
MFDVNATVTRYLACWNETDAEKRRHLISKTWTDDGTYVDAHRRGDDHESIDAMIDAVQRHLPGYRLSLRSGIEAHNGLVRFSWSAGGSPDAPLYIAGTDFAALTPDGRLQSVAGFTDAAPAPINNT